MTAKITVTLDGKPVSEHVLDKETITIGRKSSNDIEIDSMAVSGRHCQILNILNDSFLEDLESTNGTFVNGNRVKKYALSEDDVIVIGRHHLRFNKTQADNELQDDDRTVAIGSMGGGGVLDTFSASGPAPQDGAQPPQPQAPPPPQPQAPPQPQPQAPPQPQASPPPQPQASPPPQPQAPPPAPDSSGQYGSLQLLNTARAGRTMELTKPVTTIGKPGSQVAAITLRKNGYFIVVVDSGGENLAPPKVNSSPLGNQVVMLNNNDVIEIAGVKLLFTA